jgi:predicted O-methyltransferase YrrM
MAHRLLRHLGKALRNPGSLKESFQYAVQRRIFPKDPQASRIASWWHGDLPRVDLATVFPEARKQEIVVKQIYERTPGTSVDIMELISLLTIAQVIQAKCVLEIGTFDGNTALNLAANTPVGATIVTVDLPEQWDGKFQVQVPTDHQNITDRRVTGGQYKGRPEQAKITQVLGDSAALDWSQLPAMFDLAFIDGCHSYEYATLDTKNVLQRMRPGGVVVWHDYGQIPEVSRAVDETTGLKKYAIQGTRLAVGIMP